MKRFFALFLTAALYAAAAVAAVPAGASAKPAPHKMVSVPPATPAAVTEHTIELGGQVIHYTARAGTITLRNQADQPTARIFYVAYTEDGSDLTRRPVTFLYNGGPGSSTMWLHMGAFGPVHVVTGDGTITGPPPYRIVTNPNSLLNKTDLVFIDMPDTGFGRIVGAGKPKDFFGVDQDARAFAQFVQRYITQFDRWNSPKFIFGESYGTTRSAALAAVLQQDGIALNGVVLQSSILNFNLDWNQNFGYKAATIGGGDWGFVLYLPTEAATAWYHHKVTYRGSLQSFLKTLQHFAMGEYLGALAKGDSLSGPEYNDVVRKLHEYTGLSEQYIKDSHLRIQYGRFEKALLRNQGKIVGRLDSRFETYTLDPESASAQWDPTDSAIDAAYTTAVNQYIRQTLKYNPPISYRSSAYAIIHKNGGWDWKHDGQTTTNVAVDLAETMVINPHLQVFSANGYYDFATPYLATVYTLSHLNLPPALQKHITYGFYKSGHMIYLNPASLVRYRSDLDRWYDRVLSGR